MLNKSRNTGYVNMDIHNTSQHLRNLMNKIPWESGFGNRKVCQIGCDYTYSGKTVKGHPFEIYKPLQGLLDKVNNQLGTNFNSILLNWYPKNTLCGIGGHSDNEPELVPNSPVLSISLGQTVRFTIYNVDLGEQVSVDLEDGDVFLMDENCQEHYKHYIPKERMYDDRISLTFREFRTTDTKPKTKTTGLSKDDFTNYTGGAYGVDTYGDVIGRLHGFNNHVHYRPAGNPRVSAKLRKAGVTGVELSPEDNSRGMDRVNSLLNKNYRNDIRGKLQGRNYFQVDSADSVFCFGFLNGESSITGGTNTALQLAIALNKLAYVYDINSSTWYKYNYDTEKLVPMTIIPEITPNYAIVGTRDVEDYHVQNNGIWGSRPQYVGDELAKRTQKAISELYVNTINLLDL